MANENKSKTVKIRIRHGRMLIARGVDGGEDRYASVGEIVEVDRKWAEKLAGRMLDGYPPMASGQPGERVGLIPNSPIEIIG